MTSLASYTRSAVSAVAAIAAPVSHHARMVVAVVVVVVGERKVSCVTPVLERVP